MELLLARQPIFDREERVVAYALLHRGVGQRPDADPYAMAEHVLVDATLGTGVERLADGHLAYLKLSLPMLLGDTVRLLDPRRIALEIRADMVETAEARLACERLALAGFVLALDRFAYTPATAAVLPLVRVVKVDVRGRAAPELAQLVAQVRPYRVRLLAEHAEHRGVRDLCVTLGFELFQGISFAQPETVTRRDLPIQHVQTFKLLKELRDPDLHESAIEESFRRDVALSYKLLRMVNSAAVGGRGIWSIGHAIRLLGREALYRWLTLLLFSSAADGGVKGELTYLSLMRGRLCELLATEAGMRPAAGPLFLVGVFSMLDLMMGLPMADVVSRLDVDGEVADALVRRDGFFGAVLALVEAYEMGDWDAVDYLGEQLAVERGALAARYLESVAWAHERLGQLAEPATPVAVG